MKNKTLKEQRLFYKQVEETLIGYGAKKADTQCSGFKYELKTEAGILNVSCHEPDKSQILSIYLRFSDYNKAVNVLGIADAIQYLNYKLQKVNAIALCLTT